MNRKEIYIKYLLTFSPNAGGDEELLKQLASYEQSNEDWKDELAKAKKVSKTWFHHLDYFDGWKIRFFDLTGLFVIGR